MELFIALGLPIVLLVGFTLLFMADGIPSWIQNLNKNFGKILMRRARPKSAPDKMLTGENGE